MYVMTLNPIESGAEFVVVEERTAEGTTSNTKYGLFRTPSQFAIDASIPCLALVVIRGNKHLGFTGNH